MIRKFYKNLAFLIAATGNMLVFLPLFRLFKNRYPCYAIPEAEICIEGFPRSGNSFFVTVFQQWNPGVIIAHHTHLASNAKYFARKSRPTVILIREPAEAISSAIAWDGTQPRIAPGVGLFTYLSFYRSLRKYKKNILFLDFDEATSKPEACIEKINQRFGTSYKTIEFTDEERHRIRRALIQHDMERNRSELNSSLPNERKTQLKKAIYPEIVSHHLFRRARYSYESHTSLQNRKNQVVDAQNGGIESL